jgi:hypothetical protein
MPSLLKADLPFKWSLGVIMGGKEDKDEEKISISINGHHHIYVPNTQHFKGCDNRFESIP